MSWSSKSLKLDTNTEDIAIVGDGGDIELEWDIAPGNATSQTGKMTYESLNMKQTSFSGRDSSSAVVAGTFLSEDFSGTGYLTVNKGKVIMQIKDPK